MKYKEAYRLYKAAAENAQQPAKFTYNADAADVILPPSYFHNFVDFTTGAKPSKPTYDDVQQASIYNNIVKQSRPVTYMRKGGVGPMKTVIAPDMSEPLGGKPFNINYTTDNAKPGQHAIIAIGGALDNGNNDFANSTGVPEHNVARFRYSDEKQALQLARDLRKKGITVQLFGHSRGGDVADRIGKQLQDEGLDVEVHLFDPVSDNIFSRGKSIRTKGANVYLPSKPGTFSGGFDSGNLVANIGGRMRVAQPTGTYEGTHGDGFDKLLHQLASRYASPEKGKLTVTRKRGR